MGKKISKHKIIVSLAGIMVAIIVTSLMWQTPLLLIISLCSITMIKHHFAPVRHELIMFVIVGLLGPITESLIMYSGAWSYADVDFLNFPIWLPFLWGLAGTLFATIYDALPKTSKS